MILLAVIVIALACIYAAVRYFNNTYKYWQLRNVPYEEPTMFFGSFLNLFFEKDNLRRFLDRTSKKFDSPYYGFFIFNKPFLVVKDLEIVKRIMIRDFASFPNKLFLDDKECDPVFNNSLFGTRDQEWRSLRHRLSPVFTSGKLKGMLSLIAECGERLESHLDKISNESVEVTDVLSRYSTEVISSCAFGVKCDCFQKEVSEFQRYGEDIFPKGAIGLIKNISYIFVHSIARFFKLSFLNQNGVKYFRKVFKKVLSQRMTQSTRRNDFVDLLLDLKSQEENDESFGLDDERMLAQAIPFFAAGHETTTAIVSFVLHELSLNSAIQDRLRQEIQSVVNNHGEISYQALEDMKYLKMVILETLRKYPIISFIQRQSLHQYTIPETGLQLERGTGIIVPIRGFHHNPMYFPDPEVYDPERFSDDNKQQRDSNLILAFGIGPRNCLGKRFAWITMKMAMVYILRNFKVEKNSQTAEVLSIISPHVSRSPSGVNLTFKRL
ncbi:cytochrome P450 6k1-like [Photinus pyralis]|nr:cytochrome P450 6k1-like [Photinus pyralis]